MRLFDVNLYVHAHREDAPLHAQARAFIQACATSGDALGYSPLALSGFLRVVTHPKVFSPPTDPGTALRFCESIREHPGAVEILPGSSHWAIFRHLVAASGARGNLVPDAWFAALAIEHDCTWATTDRDYSRFPGLKVEYPLT